MKRSLKVLLLAGVVAAGAAGCASDPYYYDNTYTYYDAPTTYYTPRYYAYNDYYGPPAYYYGPTVGLGFTYHRYRWR